MPMGESGCYCLKCKRVLNLLVASSFNEVDLAVAGALQGRGVALGRTPLVMDDIRKGGIK